VAIDPGPPAELVIVEVRWRRRRDFGLPEETVGPLKRGRLWAAAARLAAEGRLPDGRALPTLPLRLDLVAVEPDRDSDGPRMRHHRHLGGG
jgi:Holliday junction resolvase-like predicted endonuclease